MIKLTHLICFMLIACIHGNAQQTFVATCPSLGSNGLFPKLYTCDSSAISPPIQWQNAPTTTKSFAITMHHFPKEGDKHVYMVLYNIPETVMELQQAQTNIGNWSSNTQNKQLAYSPPCSKGPGLKEYIITVYALSKQLAFDKSKPVSMDELILAMKDCTLASSAFTVKYAR